MSMQDIKTSKRKRERTIANTGDLFRGSSTLALRPRLQHYEGFSLESIPPDHSVPQHLQALGLPSPVHTASSLARRGRTSNTEFTRDLETRRTHASASSRQRRSLWWSQHFDHLKFSHNKDPYRIGIAMDGSSVVWENKDGSDGGKTQRNHF